jgi:hypothetical protein
MTWVDARLAKGWRVVHPGNHGGLQAFMEQNIHAVMGALSECLRNIRKFEYKDGQQRAAESTR